MIHTGLRRFPLVPVISACESPRMSPIAAVMVPPAVAVVAATPLRKPAGRVVLAAVASSSTVSIATEVSSEIASRNRLSILGWLCSKISLVKDVIVPIFFGVKLIDVNAAWRTGIGLPCATKLPATVGVDERVGIVTIPAVPKVNFMPRDDRPG